MLDIEKYGTKKLHSKWLNREWCGMNIRYGDDYRLLDGMREIMVECLMELNNWDKAINIIMLSLNDKYTPYSVLTQMNIHLMHCYIRKGQWDIAHNRILTITTSSTSSTTSSKDDMVIPYKVRNDLEKSFGWNCHIAIIQFENHHYSEALRAAEAAKVLATSPSSASFE